MFGNRLLPRGREDVRLVGRTVGAVLSGPAYAVLALVASVVSLLGIVVAQNMSLFTDVVLFGSLPVEARLEILYYMLPFVSGGTDPVTGAGMVVTSLLVGVNVAMLAYHLSTQGLSVVHGSGSIAGIVLGTMGAGCAACGAAIASAVLGLFGAAGVVTVLPFGGLEFLLAAIVFVPLSTFWLVQGIQYGDACPVDLS